MKSENIEVYAIILNYNSSKEAIGLYNNLVENFGVSLKILVVDNASAKADREQLKKNIPEENIIFNSKNSGYAGGNNIGIKRAIRENANYVWILNPDIRVEKNTLSILVETLQNNSTLAAVGPRILKRENPDTIFTDGEKLLMDKKCHTHQKNHNKSRHVIEPKIDFDIDYIDGSCILINSRAIEDVGFLPEEYFLYFEETDWCSRAKKRGYKLAVNSHAIVYNLTSIKKETFHYYFMRNRLIFSKKFHPNFNKVRRYYLNLVFLEFINRLKGKYFSPFYKSRVKGLISGIFRTI
ncbi:glycosyltransferase family 2 protein [Salegentibacter sp. F14]